MFNRYQILSIFHSYFDALLPTCRQLNCGWYITAITKVTVLELCIEPKDQFLSGGSCRVVNRALGVLRVWDPSSLCTPSGPIPSLSLSLHICTRKELDDGLQGSLTRNFPSRFSLRNRFSCETLGQAQGQPAVVLAISHYRTNDPGT